MKKKSTIKIGKKIQQIRKSNGYTQEKLAEKIEVSARHISDIEQDRSKPSYEVLIRICNLFQIGMDQIFSDYLNIKEKAGLECELIGYNNLDKKDKETIENLIMFFNKQSK